jgi:drug/metabolite transporter (DMT)-like permease
MFNLELLGTLFGLAAAASWGAGDFSGGLAARRSHTYMVVIVSGTVGLLLLIGLALLLAEPLPSLPDLAWGGAAGIAGAIGLAALYHGLAVGRMGVVAPVTALVTATIPLFLGLFLEGIPAVQQLLGFGLALVAVWLLSQTGNGTGVQVREPGLPLVAGLGFGFFLVVIGRVSQTAVLWPLAAARLASTSVLLIVVSVTGQGGKPAVKQLPLMALAGILDTGGNALYALATQVGRLDTAAVLSSLYPGATVLLARFLLKERLSRQQWVGVVAALVAVVLIAA